MNYDIKTLELDKIIARLKEYACTDYAKRKIDNLGISDTYEEIIELNSETKDAYNAIVRLDRAPLGGVYDIADAIKRASKGSTLNELELVNIISLIDATANVERFFKSLDNIKVEYPSLIKYRSELVILQTLKTNITLAISPDGRVLDNASRELFVIRRSLSSLENRLKSKLNELLVSRASQLTESLIVQRDGRYCLPVKIEFKNTFKGIVHDVSSSNTTAYIEPEATLETANQIENYKANEKKEIQVILKNLSLLVGSESDSLLKNLEALTSLDIIFAKAMMGKENDYNVVNIENSQSFVLKKCKHPLIEREKCVPIDIEIGNKFSTIIITGPNTGGKTVALKTVGLLHLMAYLGLMVPADSQSKFGYFSSIYADIGDEQSIEQSLSTFSSHITKISKILDEISFESLVLFDELGSGTDPKEGSSLAVSIIDYLRNSGAKTICTTHYSELKSYAYKHQDICNASVEFNTQTLMPTYRLLLGVPGKSNAIEIASKLGINEKIINSAKEYLADNQTESGELMGNLEEEMNRLREKEEELERKLAEANRKVAEINREKIELVKSHDKIINESKREAAKIIEKAKEETEKLITEIKNMSDTSFKEHELAEIKRKSRALEAEEEDSSVFNEALHEGDYVYVKNYQKYGTIAKIRKDKYTVNIGQFSMEFKKSELTLAAKPKEEKPKKTRLSGYNPASHAELSLDLRGKRYEEVNYLMDQYLDQAILGNLETVRIIHGFGTGAIRKAVQEYLKNCPYVKSYRYGQEGEGLNGVTVVKLK